MANRFLPIVTSPIRSDKIYRVFLEDFSASVEYKSTSNTASDKLFVRFAKVPYTVDGIYFSGEKEGFNLD